MATIGVFISIPNRRGQSKWARNLKVNLVERSSKKHSFTWTCMCDSRIPELTGYKQVICKGEHLEQPECLQFIYDHIDTDYVLISHSDIMITRKNWDDIMVQSIDNSKPLCGVAEDQSIRMAGFPSTIFTLFESKTLLKLKPRLDRVYSHQVKGTPGMHTDRRLACKIVLNEEESKLYGHPIGSKVKLDGGYGIPLAYIPQGYGSTNISIVNINSSSSPIHIPTNLTEETKHRMSRSEVFLLDGELFGAHFSASAHRHFKDKAAREWRQLVNAKIG